MKTSSKKNEIAKKKQQINPKYTKITKVAKSYAKKSSKGRSNANSLSKSMAPTSPPNLQKKEKIARLTRDKDGKWKRNYSEIASLSPSSSAKESVLKNQTRIRSDNELESISVIVDKENVVHGQSVHSQMVQIQTSS
ncbi:11725_t:CDS:2 [Ambispora gerdemannii]|uniref:11725_t:CDS:1 n=1 Tax=Ambispora gerdemannii TaxID=144530 RepID=A0A9N9BVS1_9GLOM|nr:11725_t:CDS:2 [Ambispora gerdemannii]